MARRILISGGAGFIGSNLVRFWLQRHEQDHLVIVDYLGRGGRRENLHDVIGQPGLTFVQSDARDATLMRALLAEHGIDTIIHLAAESHVDRSIADPVQFIENNILATASLLEAARREWSPQEGRWFRFHHVSTDEVFGSLGSDDPPFVEGAPYRPRSPYAASKAASDHLLSAYEVTYGLPVSVTFCSNNYGPFQDPEKLIPRCIGCVLTGSPIPLFGDGRNVRDWIHVQDHCRAIEAVLDAPRSGQFNIGAGQELENRVLLSRLCGLIDEAFQSEPALVRRFPNAAPARGNPSETLVQYVPDRPGHDFRYASDWTRASRQTGFRPKIGLDEGLRTTLQWYLRHADWLLESFA